MRSVWYRVAMAAAMVIVVLNTWLAVRALHALVTAQGWRAHTLDVITHTKALELEVSMANSGVRGYLLTGSEPFEERYREAARGVAAEIEALRQLTADNASQQQRIAYLRARVTIKLAALETGISVRRDSAGPLDDALLQPIMSDSPDAGPTVSYVIGHIEAEEQRLLLERTRETTTAHTEVYWSFLGASLLDLLLLLAAAELLIRTLRDRHTLSARSAQITLLNSELAGLNVELTALNTDLEARVLQRTREVEQRTRQLEVSNQELEAFSYSVSHDLRAPLRTIDGFSLALLEDFADKLNDEGRDYIARVRGGVQRMGTLIDALLQLSRVTRTELQTERVDLSKLAGLVFNELQASEPNRVAEFDAQPDVMVEGDPRLLRIALENLLGNAWKFTSKTPATHIAFGSRPGTAKDAGPTVYFIRDNGAGFDMQYVDRLFTAFQRLHGDRDFKGSGIGLATVSRIIRRHHGTLGAESGIGQGATFYFSLPAEPVSAVVPTL